MKPPAPPRVASHYLYCNDPPPERSARCRFWVQRIEQEGWRPNSRISGMGYDSLAEYYGIYIWELFNVIRPLLARLDETPEAKA